jgi:mycofactocin precursor
LVRHIEDKFRTIDVLSMGLAESERKHDDAADDSDLIEEDLLVEEISIDGLCGVY